MTARADAFSASGVRLDAEALIQLRAEVVHGGQTPTRLSMLPGGFAMKRRGHGQDIADIRAYVDGDDMRHLDRGATARTGEIHIRTFQQERDRIAMLVADFRPSMFWGMRRAFRSVAAAEALALLGWQTVEAGGRVGLLALTATDQIVVPARGRTRGMLDVIKGMVSAHADALSGFTGDQSNPPLDQSLQGLKRIAPTGSEILIATDLDEAGPDFDDLMGDLSRRRMPVILLVEDGAARNLPEGAYPLRTPGGRQETVLVRHSADPVVPTDGGTVPIVHIDAGLPPADQLRSLSM